MTKKQISLLIVAVFSVALSGCITQEFENDSTPVVKNQANRNDMAVTRISLGLGYLKMGNMPQAKQNLEKAKKFAPDMVQVYTAYAHYYETVGEHTLTIESFEKALSLKGDDADTLNNYGVYLCRQDQIEAAEKQFLKAIAVPSYLLVAKSYENLSACFLQKDNFIKAEKYLNKAIRHSPSSASTLFQMVTLQYAMADYQQAKVFEQRFEKVTRRFTSQSLALAYKVYWKLRDRRTAKNYGAMLVKMYPQSWEAQQYLLNELELIAADNLAKRYKLTQESEISTKSKKRVVKLSPKKALPSSSTSSNTIPSNSVENSRLVEPKLKSQTAIPVLTVSTPGTTNTALASPSTSAASSMAISAALTMGGVEAVNSAPELEQGEITSIAEQKVSVNTNTRDQNKRVVILAAPTAEEKTPIVDNEISPVAELITNTKTDVEVLAKKELPLEDQEIFHIAKKPVVIIEDVPKVAEPLTAASTETQKSAGVSHKPSAIHVVSTGDTLYGISIKYNIKIKALRRWNNITGNKKIRINDELHLIDPKTVNE